MSQEVKIAELGPKLEDVVEVFKSLWELHTPFFEINPWSALL